MISSIVIAAMAAWVISQLLKVIIGIIIYGKGDLCRIRWRLMWASGMPSSHSAVTVSALIVMGLSQGLNSPVFALAFLLTSIVIYDRSRMFHTFTYLQSRFPDLKRAIGDDPILRALIGHKLLEVAVGVVIGLLAGLIVHAVSASAWPSGLCGS